MTSAPFRESRLPVGSSARSTSGRPATARATATRCCCPPDELGRIVVEAVQKANALERLVRGALALARGHAAIDERQLDVLVHREIADQVEGLEDEADGAGADPRALRLIEAHRPALPART